MGFFYKKDGENKTIGCTFSIKFGSKKETTQDKTASWAKYILSIVEGCGASVISSDDTDPNKDKRIL